MRFLDIARKNPAGGTLGLMYPHVPKAVRNAGTISRLLSLELFRQQFELTLVGTVLPCSPLLPAMVWMAPMNEEGHGVGMTA